MEYCSEFVCDPPKRCTSGFLIDCQAENNHCVYSEERKAVKNGNN